MKMKRADLLSAGLVMVSFAMAGALYGRLPDPVPIHWNIHGRADGFMAKPWGVFLLPLAMAAVWALLWVLPQISPRGYRLERSRRAFAIIQVSVMAFFLAVTALALLAGTGAPVPMGRAIPAFVGALFVVLGNVLPKVRRNFFVGIRTPWTLASDEVWLRTHRVGGALFVLAGLVLIGGGVFGAGGIVIGAAVFLVAVVPVVYSYVIYRRLEPSGPPEPPEPDADHPG